MARTIKYFLMDDDVTGRIKCSLANWTGIAYKIPRTMFSQCDSIDSLNNSGIYFLFGTCEDGTPFIYVGQAVERKNRKGMLNRILEPHSNRNNEKFDDWTEAIMITTTGNILGHTDVCYLENRFCNLAKAAKRYKIINGNEPNPGNITEETKADLEEFIEYAKLVTGVLGHKVFEPVAHTVQPASGTSENLLHMTNRGSDATGQRVSDGFVVFAGSVIAPTLTNSCPDFVQEQRRKYADKIDQATNALTSDILFSSPSAAACFVGGASLNGNSQWLNSVGKSLKDLEMPETT
ncbi:MAG: GIY-YIG nuclease family protein [Clostridia bacterium]|nr:GIY-YIG nuclease family protein [Clostridia bacterium]